MKREEQREWRGTEMRGERQRGGKMDGEEEETTERSVKGQRGKKDME